MEVRRAEVFGMSFLNGAKALAIAPIALCAVAVISASAHAAPVAQKFPELIVRYRQPQNSKMQALQLAQRLTQNSATDAQILNGSEGVLKLKFGSVEDSEKARARLELNPDVISVSPNLLYRPSIHYQMRKARPAPHSNNTFLTVPFFSSLATGDIPEVALPSAQTEGADPLESKDWALANIRLPAQGEFAPDPSAAIVAAVIDTGIDYNHEDLAPALWRNPSNDREVGYDFAHNNNKPYDLRHFDVEGCLKDLPCAFGLDQSQFLVNPGHGTHCAGHVGAVANNSHGIRGVASNRSRVMGLKFFYDFGEEKAGQGDDAGAIQSIDYAVTHGAKIISASWGGKQSHDEAEASELKQALIRAQKAGVLVIIAAGNDGSDQDESETPSYPAAYELDNLIVVAATDSKDGLARFSNYGAKSVHIGAPGVKILSTTADGKYSDLVASFKDESGAVREFQWDGTSMATPIVAGAAALIWSKFPNEDYHQIRDRILKSARSVPGLAGKVSTGGTLDVAAALAR